ncbi:hypothetical protein [Pseudomonas monteilii]|uniref:hypothetical protein n=1 Tax=Pseudomonas monteilii TaxID=76759 RepID=UPI001F166B8D|nr:hypothetical protein [Pseudomonas monteilii]
MGFDISAFNKAKMEHATATVDVPTLQPFFFGDAKAKWTVRGMTHTELCRMRETKQNDKLLNTAIAAVAGNEEDKQKLIKEIVGDVDGVHESTRRSIEQLVMCSVEPKIDRQVAVRLSQFYPAEFQTLSDKIFELSQDGPVVAKKKPLRSTTQ